jgi:hypothetical protein
MQQKILLKRRNRFNQVIKKNFSLLSTKATQEEENKAKAMTRLLTTLRKYLFLEEEETKTQKVAAVAINIRKV